MRGATGGFPTAAAARTARDSGKAVTKFARSLREGIQKEQALAQNLTARGTPHLAEHVTPLTKTVQRVEELLAGGTRAGEEAATTGAVSAPPTGKGPRTAPAAEPTPAPTSIAATRTAALPILEDAEACLKFATETKFDSLKEWEAGVHRIWVERPEEMPMLRLTPGGQLEPFPAPTVRSTLSFQAKNEQQAIMLGEAWVGEGAELTTVKGKDIPCLVSPERNIGGHITRTRSFRYPHPKETTCHTGELVANFEEIINVKTANGLTTINTKNIHLIVKK